LKILAYQPLITGINSAADRRSHVRNMVQKLELHCRQEPEIELILLPELATIEYSFTSFSKLVELAEPTEGDTFDMMSSLARRTGCAISYGFPHMHDGKYFISQVMLGPSGELLTKYSKLHLAQFGSSIEKEFFSIGDGLSVIELGGLRIGTIICYDFRFSELIRHLVVRHEVDAILHPVAFEKDGSYVSWHPFVIARALEYQIYFFSLNRAGKRYGNSILCPPWIDEQSKPLIMGEEEEICLFTLNKQEIHAARETYPFRKDMLANYSVLEPES